MNKYDPSYTAHKNVIMSNVVDRIIGEIRDNLSGLKYKYVNNTEIFDTDEQYASFCKSMAMAAILKQISNELADNSK